jgi:hypothetical protein
VVDEVRILRLLRSITDDISVLSHESGADESRREDPMWLRGGFRNVLVHEYIRVNDDIVIDRLKALGDLQDFVSQVAAFVTYE